MLWFDDKRAFDLVGLSTWCLGFCLSLLPNRLRAFRGQ